MAREVCPGASTYPVGCLAFPCIPIWMRKLPTAFATLFFVALRRCPVDRKSTTKRFSNCHQRSIKRWRPACGDKPGESLGVVGSPYRRHHAGERKLRLFWIGPKSRSNRHGRDWRKPFRFWSRCGKFQTRDGAASISETSERANSRRVCGRHKRPHSVGRNRVENEGGYFRTQ